MRKGFNSQQNIPNVRVPQIDVLKLHPHLLAPKQGSFYFQNTLIFIAKRDSEAVGQVPRVVDNSSVLILDDEVLAGGIQGLLVHLPVSELVHVPHPKPYILEEVQKLPDLKILHDGVVEDGLACPVDSEYLMLQEVEVESSVEVSGVLEPVETCISHVERRDGDDDENEEKSFPDSAGRFLRKGFFFYLGDRRVGRSIVIFLLCPLIHPTIRIIISVINIIYQNIQKQNHNNSFQILALGLIYIAQSHSLFQSSNRFQCFTFHRLLTLGNFIISSSSMFSSRNQLQTITKISALLPPLRQSHTTSPKAKFWFGGVWSLLQKHAEDEWEDDLTIDERIEVTAIMNLALCDITIFYGRELPSSVFLILGLMREHIIEPVEPIHEQKWINTKLAYLNSLVIYSLKSQQYAFVKQLYQQILDILQDQTVDQISETFLVTLSNYILYLKKISQHNKTIPYSNLLKAQQMLKQIFDKLLRKISSFPKDYIQSLAQILSLMVGIFKQNRSLLQSLEQELNLLALVYYEHILKSKKKLPANLTHFIYATKVKNSTPLKIDLKIKQAYFYTHFLLSKEKFASKIGKKRISEIRSIAQQLSPERYLTKIETMLEKSLQLLTDNKNSRYGMKSLALERSVQLSPIGQEATYFMTSSLAKDLTQHSITNGGSFKETLTPLPLVQPKVMGAHHRTLRVRKISKREAPVKHKALTFKLHSIFIEVNEDGILLSDYTKQNKRYVEWNTLSLIMEKISLHFTFEEILKVGVAGYYDFARMLIMFLTKKDNKQISMGNTPLPLLEINPMIKIYRQEGKFVKIALMNQYDPERFVGVIDGYLVEFNEFFKEVCENQYIQHLNGQLCTPLQQSFKSKPDKDQNVYYINFHKKKRETSATELEQQLPLQNLEYCIEEKNCLYRAIFLLKNNSRIFVRIINPATNSTQKGQIAGKDEFPEFITLKVNSLDNDMSFLLKSQFSDSIASPSSSNNPGFGNQNSFTAPKHISRTIEIPLSSLTTLFPTYGKSYKEYVYLHQRMIVDCFSEFVSKEPNLGGASFELITFVSKSQAVEYGKYMTQVSAELVGSQGRVWALIIRYYELAWLDYKTCCMVNPYDCFLKDLANYSEEEKRDILGNLLIEGSVKETWLWLKRAGITHQRISLMDYLTNAKII